MQHRLQQANINDRERRILLSQLESRTEAQKALVTIYHCRNEYGFNFTTNQNEVTSKVANTMVQATSNEVSLPTNCTMK